MPSAYTTILQQFYLAYFGRPADPVGLQTTSQALANAGAPTTLAGLLSSTNATVIALINGFGSSAESTALYTGGTTARVTAIYQNVLNRNPDVGGLLYWSTEIDSGRLSLARVALAVIEAGARDVNDGPLVTAKTNVAISYTASVDTVAEINAYNGNTAAASARTLLSTVTAATTTAAFQASVDSNIAALVSTNGGAAVGVSLVLTTGVDTINGTSGNDTITADNTLAAKQLTVADTINGGAGIDTLRIFLAAADTATGQPALSGIENVSINGGAITAYTAAAGTTGLIIDTPIIAAAGTATYTLSGQALTLQNVTGAAAAAAATVAVASAADTVANVTLNAVTNNTTGVTTLDVTAAKVATLNLTSTGANSALTINGTTALTTLTAAGDKNLTLVETAASAAAITTVNAATLTGVLNLNTTAATVAAGFKFTGGTNGDTVTLAVGSLAALTSGAQLDGGAGADRLGIFETTLAGTALARVNQAVNFETLGLNAAITLDASTLTSFKNFSIDTTALKQTISNLATGSVTTITAAAPTSLTLGTNVGVTDTGIVLAGGNTVAALVTTGITNVSLTSSGTTANAITTLTNSDNSVFTIKGTQDVTLSLAAGTAVGSRIDAAAFTGKATLTGSALTGSGDIIIGGTGADTLNGNQGADTLTGGAGIDTFSFTATAGANASGATFGQADIITDFVTGTDRLQFAGVVDVVSAQQGAVQTAVSALAAGSSNTAIATAIANANTTNLGVSFAVFGGNTYVLFETSGAGAGVAADDVFIQLTGVTTLPTFANAVIA